MAVTVPDHLAGAPVSVGLAGGAGQVPGLARRRPVSPGRNIAEVVAVEEGVCCWMVFHFRLSPRGKGRRVTPESHSLRGRIKVSPRSPLTELRDPENATSHRVINEDARQV